ncbi:hypothetical protein GCM10027088_22790 [Nocardia goodfellowii]
MGGQRTHGRVLEQDAHRHLGPERAGDPSHDLGGDQRIAAEGEEVVVQAGLRDAEDLTEYLGDDPFRIGPRRSKRSVRQDGVRQGVPVQFARAGQRHRIERHVRRRHHV